MYPGQTDSGPGATTAEASSAHQSAPPLLSAEAAANIRAEAALNPVRAGQGPQNEEKRTLEGESRTNVPRTETAPDPTLQLLKLAEPRLDRMEKTLEGESGKL